MPANPLGVLLRSRRAGHHTLAWAHPDLHTSTEFALFSPAFEHGAAIPARHRGRFFGDNISPALNWAPPPADAAELLLVVQDPDVPLGRPATHLLMVGIDPALTGLPHDGLGHPSRTAGIRHGRGALFRRGWTGPMPIASHGPHAYVFQLFALDAPPLLPGGFGLRDGVRAMKGHVVGRARLDGTYEIR